MMRWFSDRSISDDFLWVLNLKYLFGVNFLLNIDSNCDKDS